MVCYLVDNERLVFVSLLFIKASVSKLNYIDFLTKMRRIYL